MTDPKPTQGSAQDGRDSEALKPCPFCGGPVYLERAPDTRSEIHGIRKWWGVICRNTENLGGTCAIWQNPSASKEAAIERWNRRAEIARPAPEALGAAKGELSDAEILRIFEKETGFSTESNYCIVDADILGYTRAILKLAENHG